MRKLIMRVFYVNISNMTKQKATEHIFNLIEACKNHFPEDIKKQYYIEDIFMPIIDGETRIDILYPNKLDDENLIINLSEHLDDIEKINDLIEKLTQIKNNLVV